MVISTLFVVIRIWDDGVSLSLYHMFCGLHVSECHQYLIVRYASGPDQYVPKYHAKVLKIKSKNFYFENYEQVLSHGSIEK